MKIERLSRENIDKIAELEKSIFSGRDQWPLPAFETEFRNPDAVWFVALEGDSVVGVWRGMVCSTRIPPPQLGVHPDFRRRGLARQGVIGCLWM